VRHHAASFRRAAADPELAAAVERDPDSAELSPRERALADFARSLTLAPAADGAERISALRAAGFDDDAILRATEIVAYFNFVNRMAHGLGVELEPENA
jgi:uncharacterized peroxidase-related enzyme